VFLLEDSYHILSIHETVVSLIGVPEIGADFNKVIKRYFKLVHDLAFKQQAQNGVVSQKTAPKAIQYKLPDSCWDILIKVLGKHLVGECLSVEQVAVEVPSINADSTPTLLHCLCEARQGFSRGAIEALIENDARSSALEQEINKIE